MPLPHPSFTLVSPVGQASLGANHQSDLISSRTWPHDDVPSRALQTRHALDLDQTLSMTMKNHLGLGLILGAVALSLLDPGKSTAFAGHNSFDCELNNAVNLTEISLCGRVDWAEIVIARECRFAKHRFVIGNYQDGKAVATHFKVLPRRLMRNNIGSNSPPVEYLTLNGFRKWLTKPRLVDRHIDWGDIQWAAFCKPAPYFKAGLPCAHHNNRTECRAAATLARACLRHRSTNLILFVSFVLRLNRWDEQLYPDACSGFTNIGHPRRSCAEKVSWGRPAFEGMLGVPPFGTVPALGGSCELERWTKNKDNLPCYTAPTAAVCKTSEVVINEVDGHASRSGADWVEVRPLSHPRFGHAPSVELTSLGSVLRCTLPRTILPDTGALRSRRLLHTADVRAARVPDDLL